MFSTETEGRRAESSEGFLLKSRYVTDGVELYRVLGGSVSGASDMVGLENCRSFEVIMHPLSEITSCALRPVIPAAEAEA